MYLFVHYAHVHYTPGPCVPIKDVMLLFGVKVLIVLPDVHRHCYHLMLNVIIVSAKTSKLHSHQRKLSICTACICDMHLQHRYHDVERLVYLQLKQNQNYFLPHSQYRDSRSPATIKGTSVRSIYFKLSSWYNLDSALQHSTLSSNQP